MSGLYFLLPVLITILVSFLVVRAAAIALMLTGLDRRRAVFQALSSFTGTGFTTKEAELVVHHPMRRKIVSWLMILGNAGFVTVIVAGTTSLVSSRGFTIPLDIIILIGGIILIYKLVSNREFVRRFELYVEKKLVKTTAFEEASTEDLLHLTEGYGLVRAFIREGSELEGKEIYDCTPFDQKIMVLGIERGRQWLPVPEQNEKIMKGDRVVVYGKLAELRKIFSAD